jgi:type I restriction enzyme S subunit
LVPLPSLQEQKQIAKILFTTDNKLDTLREKKTRYEQLKKGLMQKLLTGEVRVKV